MHHKTEQKFFGLKFNALSDSWERQSCMNMKKKKQKSTLHASPLLYRLFTWLSVFSILGKDWIGCGDGDNDDDCKIVSAIVAGGGGGGGDDQIKLRLNRGYYFKCEVSVV